MRRTLAALAVLTPGLVLAQSYGAPLSGTTTPINTRFGTQTDPHVSGHYVAYTNEEPLSEIRYFNLETGIDAAIPKPTGQVDYLSDVSGTTIVFTRVSNRSAIYAFDVVSGGAPVELDPQPGSARQKAAIGGNTVAWVDFSNGSVTGETDVYAYDRPTGVATRVSNDPLLDRNPAVSPNGDVVVWVKCEVDGTSCDVFRALGGGSTWAVAPLTGPEGHEAFPDTNGTLVVYDSERAGERDIYWQPVTGGAASQLMLTGEQANPNISGNLVAFEHRDSAASGWDLMLYDVSTNTLYRLTDTPNADETLNDIWTGTDGTTHVVYAAAEDVYAFTFRIAPRDPPQTCNPKPTSCADPGDRELLASFTLTREKGNKESELERFAAEEGDGLLCVTNSGATSGWIAVNGELEVSPSSFKHSVTTIERTIDLDESNLLWAQIAGKKGTSFSVSVYGPAPKCAGDEDGEDDDHGHDEDCDDDDDDDDRHRHGRRRGHRGHDHHDQDGYDGRGHGRWNEDATYGVVASKLDGNRYLVEGGSSLPETQAAGCSTTHGDTMAFAGLALIGLWLLSSRPRAWAPVRRQRRH